MLLTVFTSTYNREKLLGKLYESLCGQSSFDFEWLVIDDASGDNTYELVESWKNENKLFPIRLYKNAENQGLQRNINRAYELAEGDFCLKVDSDDWLLPNSVETVLGQIKEIEKDEKCLGVGGTYMKPDGTMYIQGQKLPDVDECGYRDILFYNRSKYGFGMDALEAYRVTVRKKYPIPVWPTENSGPERVAFSDMARDGYYIRYYAKPIGVVNYQQDGMTDFESKNMTKQPMQMAICFNNYQSYKFYSFKERLRYSSEFIYWTMRYGKKSYIFKSKSLPLTLLALPVGVGKIIWRARK